MYIARDQDGCVFIYKYKPIKVNNSFYGSDNNVSALVDKDLLKIIKMDYLTFSNSPIKIEITIKQINYETMYARLFRFIHKR